MPWRVGDIVEYRDVRRGKPWWITPARVVEDSPERVVLWWPPGTTYQRLSMRDRDHGFAQLASGSWQLEPAVWWGGDALLVIPEGAPYSIWPHRPDGRALARWYCNLQMPLTRTSGGFDTCDWTLDIVASSDLTTWTWKDEDELAHGHAIGLYSDDDVVRIRAAGAAVAALIESRAAVFAEWSVWTPDPEWTAPELQ